MSTIQLSLPELDSSPASLLQALQRRDVPVEGLFLREITQRLYAGVTAEREIDLNLVGELLAASARLVAWKSNCLLPDPVAGSTQEDQEEPGGQPPLLCPDEIRAGAEGLAVRQGMESFPALPRPLVVEPQIEPWPVATLLRVLKDTQKRQAERVFHVVAPALIRLEVALSHVLGRLKHGGRLPLGALLRGATRRDAVIHFLAILELVRRRKVVAVQEQLFGEIVVECLDERAGIRARAG